MTKILLILILGSLFLIGCMPERNITYIMPDNATCYSKVYSTYGSSVTYSDCYGGRGGAYYFNPEYVRTYP